MLGQGRSSDREIRSAALLAAAGQRLGLSFFWLISVGLLSAASAADPPRRLTAPADSFRRPSDPPSLAPERHVLPSDQRHPSTLGSGDATRGAAADAVSLEALSADQARASFQWLADLAVRQLPRNHTGDSGWGDTKKLWAGIKIRRDGWKLTTHRRFRELRHGRWSRYTLTLPGDDRPQGVDTQIQTAEQDAHGRWHIDAVVTAPIDFELRVERWNLGVQWYSISVTGNLRVQLHSSVTIGFRADYTEVPPCLCVEPRVQQAKLVLQRFEVDRISKVGGDAAEEMGEVIEELIRQLWLEKQNERLAGKLNEAIEKHRDDLRWSPADWLTER